MKAQKPPGIASRWLLNFRRVSILHVFRGTVPSHTTLVAVYALLAFYVFGVLGLSVIAAAGMTLSWAMAASALFRFMHGKPSVNAKSQVALATGFVEWLADNTAAACADFAEALERRPWYFGWRFAVVSLVAEIGRFLGLSFSAILLAGSVCMIVHAARSS